MASKQDALEKIRGYFEELEDPRVERAKRHGLLDVIIIAVCGVVCGAGTPVDKWI